MGFLANYNALQEQKKKKLQQEAAKPILTRGVQSAPQFSPVQPAMLGRGPTTNRTAPVNFSQTTMNQSRIPANQSVPTTTANLVGQRFAAPTVVKTNTFKSPTPAGQSSLNADSAFRPKPTLRTSLTQPLANTLKSVGQGFARSTAATGAALTSIPEHARALATNTSVKPGTGTFTPQGTVQQAIYGTGQPISFASQANELGIQNPTIAPFAGAALSTLDLTGAGKSKAAKELARIAKQITPTDIKALNEIFHKADSANINEFMGIREKHDFILHNLNLQDLEPNQLKETIKGVAEQVGQKKWEAATKAELSTPAPNMGKFLQDALTGKMQGSERGFIRNPFAPKPTPPEGAAPQLSQPGETALQTRPQVPLSPQQSLSLSNDVNELKRAPEINLSNLAISSKAKDLIKQEAENIKPKLSQIIGKPLSNAEVIKNTEVSSKLFSRAVTRDDTKQWTTALLNTRQKFADMAETGVVDRDFIQTLATLRSIASDAGRKLQSFSIEAKPAEITLKQYMLENMLDLGHNVDELTEAAKGVDFNNFNEAAAFYRKFVKPKASEWIDLLRYNSMLTSPLTHIVNIASNLANSSLIAPLEKLILGSVDFLDANLRGIDRTKFSGEAAHFIKGYFENIREAAHRFGKSLKGDVPTTNLDTRNIPLTQKGTTANKVEQALSVPLKFLEASDQFFTALVEGGETAALKYRQSKGVKVDDFQQKVTTNALYRLYREEPGREGQGHLLDAVDQLTLLLQKARTSKNPYVSTIAKFTFPFVRTPMNIFKQGIEFSPIGYFNLHGATDKQTVLARAAIGSAIFAGAATLLSSGRLTWAEPTNETEKNAFKAAGRQPYSVKIGDEWVSYQKLPPPLAFPISMVAAINDAVEQQKLDENTGQLILHAVAKYGSFLSDQSYAKSMGDLVSAFQGEESSMEKLASNYPQQLIPYRALGGWLSRLTDHVQRKPDPNGSFIDKQVQLLMMNIPGLSYNVPARTDSDGNPIPAPNPIKNAFSPVRTSPTNPDKEEDFQGIQDIKRLEQEATQKIDLLKQQAEEVFNEFENLSRAEASRKLIALKRSNPALAERIQDMRDLEKIEYTDYEKKLKNASVEARANMLFKDLKGVKGADRIQRMRELEEKKILSKSVAKRLKELERENR